MFVWFQGVIAEALLFLPVTVNNTTVAMATEAEQLCLELELINIEEQMLILQMLKRRRQRRRLRRWSVRPLNRRCRKKIPEKATAGNYVLSGPITALAVRINATRS